MKLPAWQRPLTRSEVARLFRVDTKTVVRWQQAGKLQSFVTPGGHHRFDRATVEALANARARTPDSGAR